jgi:hypothetical protein
MATATTTTSAKDNNHGDHAEIKDNHDAVDDDEEEDNAIYQKKLVNRVVVSQARPLNFYVDRARRVLRLEPQLTVTGFGNTISMACTLVEVLKRQGIAKIKSIRTGMDVQPIVMNRGDYGWSQPITQITFVLERGLYAGCVQDYHQRKMIEIFENIDKDNAGKISKDEARKLNLGDNFHADDSHKTDAENFLKTINTNDLDLPNFIRYSSRLIHPLLRDKIFKQVLKDKYHISAESKAQ